MHTERHITGRLAYSRTLLFAPGNRPERFLKAVRSGADLIILDLQDGVPSLDKAAARSAIDREWQGLQNWGVPIAIRINSPQSSEGEQDLAWLESLQSVAAVMIPKAESAESLGRVHQRLSGLPLLPIIESALGYSSLMSISATPGVMRLVIGHIDFMVDSGFESDVAQTALAPLRFAVSMATRVNRLAPAVDGVTVEIGNDERLREDVMRAVHFGLLGKLCIHPQQVGVVHQAMHPTESELAWARKALAASAASNGSAVQVDGRMVDLPVVLQAQRTLARAAVSWDIS